MLNGNAPEKFTACGDHEAEILLKKVLLEIKETLSGTELCVVLGGSYGRGDGGVRQDRENGLLYNDLDFFVFARKKTEHAESLLKEIAEKYEKSLKVDVDFSRIMTVADICNNSGRLMMQELKRGYCLVCGEDLLAEYLPELPAEQLPFSEACRLLLNRGMGLYLAGEKIANQSLETDFILRNLYKAILGTADAMLIASGKYRWKIEERLAFMEKSDMPDDWKKLYREAVEFKHSPHRQTKADMISFWQQVRDFYRMGMLRTAGVQDCAALKHGLSAACIAGREISLKNLIKFCIKTRSIPLREPGISMIPAVAVLLPELYSALEEMPKKIDIKSKLYRRWLIFN